MRRFRSEIGVHNLCGHPERRLLIRLSLISITGWLFGKNVTQFVTVCTDLGHNADRPHTTEWGFKFTYMWGAGSKFAFRIIGSIVYVLFWLNLMWYLVDFLIIFEFRVIFRNGFFWKNPFVFDDVFKFVIILPDAVYSRIFSIWKFFRI